MGGIQHVSLLQITKKICKFCEKIDLWLYAAYVPSKENKADKNSRMLSLDCEWELNDYAFLEIVKKFGQPDIDLFLPQITTQSVMNTYPG